MSRDNITIRHLSLSFKPALVVLMAYLARLAIHKVYTKRMSNNPISSLPNSVIRKLTVLPS